MRLASFTAGPMTVKSSRSRHIAIEDFTDMQTDIHVVDMIATPQRLEDTIGEAQHQNVLDGFFAEEMIDAVDLVLGQYLRIWALSASAEAKSWPKGFSMITRRHAFSDCRASPARPSCSTIGPKNRSVTAR